MTILGLIALLLLGIGTEHLFFRQSDFLVTDPKWRWVEDQIKGPSENLDYVAIGSSHIWCGLKPSVLKKGLGQSEKILNFGRNWGGRDADFFIIRSLLERKKVKNLLIEFDHSEPSSAHFFSQFMIRAEDLLFEIQYWFKDFKLHEMLSYSESFKFNLATLFKLTGSVAVRPVFRPLMHLFSNLSCQDAACRKNDATDGFCTNDPELKQHPSFTKDSTPFDSRRSLRPNGSPFALESRGNYYLKRIEDAARKSGTRLNFVFLPSYNTELPNPTVLRRFAKSGQVLVPDLTAFQDKSYWYDTSHLYHVGSEIFSTQIAAQLLLDLKRQSFIHSSKNL